MRAPQLVVSDSRHRIYNIPHLEAAGMEGGHPFRLVEDDLIKLPQGSQLYCLPSRLPVAYDGPTKTFTSPKGRGLIALAAFLPPGYTITYSSAYTTVNRPRPLPLFSYCAVAYVRGGLYVTAIRIDNDRRHDSRLIDIELARKRVPKVKKALPRNRLVKHLSDCALHHGCPGAQNFFLERYEGPLPTSPSCNAACAGCISYQPKGKYPSTQPRIGFIPTPEEVRDIALFHIHNVKDPIVSFGQGCDGEPLLAGNLIEKAIRLIRSRTGKGLINMNTNASLPNMIERLFDAGLDSIRVSMNSARPLYYTRYYKPSRYSFNDVVRSIKIAKKKGGFVSINYLVMPGFTDSKGEFDSLVDFIETNNIDMIQWRNLNFDPSSYFEKIKAHPDRSDILGMRKIINMIGARFPGLMMGYFNPSRKTIKMRRVQFI